MRRTLAPFFVGFIGLTGCAESVYECGEVIEKRHEPLREWINVEIISKKIGSMTLSRTAPVFLYDDEDFILIVKNSSATGEGETKIIYVDRRTYERFNIGDAFRYSIDDVEFNDTLIKRKATAEEYRELIGKAY